ncbi:MAG: hypothetical protein ACYSUT_09715 [Planctomycetota bacterium]|jgi:uncharacterized protein YaaN involved in tellurite resistance
MHIDKNSSVAELRSELDRKRRQTLEFQATTTDPVEWSNLNVIRWDLEDLDKDIYLSQFIKNNDKLEKLIGKIEQATQEAQKIKTTLDNVLASLKKAREELKQNSAIFEELSHFYTEVDGLIDVLM